MCERTKALYFISLRQDRLSFGHYAESWYFYTMCKMIPCYSKDLFTGHPVIVKIYSQTTLIPWYSNPMFGTRNMFQQKFPNVKAILTLSFQQRSLYISPEVRTSVKAILTPPAHVLTPAEVALSHRLGMQSIPEEKLRIALSHPLFPHSLPFKGQFERYKRIGRTSSPLASLMV